MKKLEILSGSSSLCFDLDGENSLPRVTVLMSIPVPTVGVKFQISIATRTRYRSLAFADPFFPLTKIQEL